MAVDFFVFIAGLAVGSFLNVLALRTLSGQSIIWPPSACPQCHKDIPFGDNIPVASYFLLGGRCRFCRAVISFQYPAVELFTAVSFLAVVKTFGISWYALGMICLVATLIAVTITDLREKLIPHDITYPSMLVGIGFSSLVRHDLPGCLAGIAVSYILFDFIAHYGLKLYLHYHRQPAADAGDELLAAEFNLDSAENSIEDDIEVMGGGDAVLSAVIASYLGWQRLVAALLVGFIAGTVMGIFLLLREMRKAGLLRQVVRPILAGMLIGFCLLGLSTYLLMLACGMKNGLPWLQFGLLGCAGGGLMGIVAAGSKVSRPFPFGPALAAGGMTAIFWNPIALLLGAWA